MTTYTLEREDTGEHLSAYQIRDEAARLDGAATDTRWKPGDPWVPGPANDPYAGMRCPKCGKYHESALIAPTAEELAAEGSTIAEEMTRGVDRKPGWATWLGGIHHADAEWADIVARLRAMPDAYTAPPIERTVVEPVAVDYSYRQTEAWALADMVVGQSRQRDSVYEQLAPERIQDEPTAARAKVDALVAHHERHPDDRPPQDLTPAERAIVEDATQRRKKLAQAAQGERAELPAPEPEGTVRASWWARFVAAIGGATTRRRQTEQDGGGA